MENLTKKWDLIRKEDISTLLPDDAWEDLNQIIKKYESKLVADKINDPLTTSVFFYLENCKIELPLPHTDIFVVLIE